MYGEDDELIVTTDRNFNEPHGYIMFNDVL